MEQYRPTLDAEDKAHNDWLAKHAENGFADLKLTLKRTH
jgi:hypothetical protein